MPENLPTISVINKRYNNIFTYDGEKDATYLKMSVGKISEDGKITITFASGLDRDVITEQTQEYLSSFVNTLGGDIKILPVTNQKGEVILYEAQFKNESMIRGLKGSVAVEAVDIEINDRLNRLKTPMSSEQIMTRMEFLKNTYEKDVSISESSKNDYIESIIKAYDNYKATYFEECEHNTQFLKDLNIAVNAIKGEDRGLKLSKSENLIALKNLVQDGVISIGAVKKVLKENDNFDNLETNIVAGLLERAVSNDFPLKEGAKDLDEIIMKISLKANANKETLRLGARDADSIIEISSISGIKPGDVVDLLDKNFSDEEKKIIKKCFQEENYECAYYNIKEFGSKSDKKGDSIKR